MATNYVFDDVEDLIDLIRGLQESHPDRVWITGVRGKGSIKAPTKRVKTAVYAVEQHYSPECFVGNSVDALMSSGGIMLRHVPRERVNPDLLKSKESDE